MPIYVYKCGVCGAESEEIRRVAEMDCPVECSCSKPIETEMGYSQPLMTHVPSAVSFGFKTAGGNYASFSGAHGPVTKGNRRPKKVRLGGRRAFRKDRIAVNPLPKDAP